MSSSPGAGPSRPRQSSLSTSSVASSSTIDEPQGDPTTGDIEQLDDANDSLDKSAHGGSIQAFRTEHDQAPAASGIPDHSEEDEDISDDNSEGDDEDEGDADGMTEEEPCVSLAPCPSMADLSKLKYSRLKGRLPEILAKDEVSAIAVGSRVIVGRFQ